MTRRRKEEGGRMLDDDGRGEIDNDMGNNNTIAIHPYLPRAYRFVDSAPCVPP